MGNQRCVMGLNYFAFLPTLMFTWCGHTELATKINL